MTFIISIALQLGQFRVPFLKSGNTLGGGRPLTSAAAALIPPSVPRTRISERDYSLRIAARRRCRRRGRESE